MDGHILECEKINKSFFGVPVLRNVSLTVRLGEVCGLVGENGAGKSTLMNILGGVVAPDSSTLLMEGAPYAPKDPAEASARGIAFIHQELSLFPNLSVAENLCVGSMPRRCLAGVPLPLLDRRTIRVRASALLSDVELDVDPDSLVEDLSPGERQLVEIAKALGSNARLIIFDEPTTSLTAHESERLFIIIQRLRMQGFSMIYISHILEDVLRLCDRIVVLRDGEVVGAGPRTEFTMQRLITLMVGRTIEQLYPARRQADLRLATRGLRHEENQPPAESTIQNPLATAEPSGAGKTEITTPVLLEVRALSQPGVIENIDFALHRGEILGVGGLMGSGRSELARILFGLDPCERGEILFEGVALDRSRPRERIARGMAFLTENRREEGLMMEATITENLALVALPSFVGKGLPLLLDRRKMRQATARAGSEVRLECRSPERQAARILSGGNQQKVVLAKWLLQRPSLLILDEPTRGIDIGAKQEIYGLINELASQGTGILLISSEIEELTGMCDRILVMSRGEIRGSVPRERFDREKILKLALGGDTP